MTTKEKKEKKDELPEEAKRRFTRQLLSASSVNCQQHPQCCGIYEFYNFYLQTYGYRDQHGQWKQTADERGRDSGYYVKEYETPEEFKARIFDFISRHLIEARKAIALVALQETQGLGKKINPKISDAQRTNKYTSQDYDEYHSNNVCHMTVEFLKEFGFEVLVDWVKNPNSSNKIILLKLDVPKWQEEYRKKNEKKGGLSSLVSDIEDEDDEYFEDDEDEE